MNSEQRHVCVLYADISGSRQLFERLDENEAMQAFERCFNRMGRAIESFRGRVVKQIGEHLMAVFDSAEDAMRAACEMQLRVEKLPAVSGIKLVVGIGFFYGPMAEGSNDATGETVKVASRLVKLAKGGQVVTTRSTVDILPEILQKTVLSLDTATVRQHDTPLPVCAVVWQSVALQAEPAEPGSSTLQSVSPISTIMTPARLRLLHGGEEIILDPGRLVLTLGRDARCDLQILSQHASRNHGRIELRRDTFVLVDKSTNGTRVEPEGGAEFLIRGGEHTLRGRGRLYFGPPQDDTQGDIIFYEELLA